MTSPKITVLNCAGVSPVAGDTTLIAEAAQRLRPKKLLDIGTGTGYIALFNAKRGVRVVGTDISTSAIACAKKNANLNKLHATFVLANLFSGISGKYDLITFNPPFGNTNSTFFSPFLERVKSIFPKTSNFLIHLSYLLVKPSRIALIRRFLKEASPFLSHKGSILLFAYPGEEKYYKKFKKKVMGKYRMFTLYQLQPEK